MDFQQAIDRIDAVWRGREEGRICRAFLYHLAGLTELPEAISTGLLRELGERTGGVTEAGIAGAIGYLVGADLNLLDMAFQYALDDGTHVPISRETFSVARKRGYLDHPRNKERDVDFESRIFLRFLISPLAREIVAAREGAPTHPFLRRRSA